MSNANRASDTPFSVDVTADKTYFWCACGLSKKQPFCDGSHNGGEFTPVVFEAKETKTLFFCGCKETKNQPLCDGSHSK